ncbi:hypothetical protein B296_00054702 [Ensete ventricosum]|uniref:Uncharacterized protein n=1 Tax=Ensete ventricosum TaxID=4639 RepID=A0A426X2N6_ENSVE|nr:hypothetical protein B296_00054702 [Ensete ventricosum]
MSQSEGGSPCAQARLHGIERRVFDLSFRRRLSYQVVVATTVLGDAEYNPLRGPLMTPQAFSCAIRCTLGIGYQDHVGVVHTCPACWDSCSRGLHMRQFTPQPSVLSTQFL